MVITKEFKFEAAHKLEDYNGPCKKLHGHSYRFEISVYGTVKSNGMVIDFKELEKIVQNYVILKLDHSYLNEIIEQPTAENIIIWICNRLNKTDLSVYGLRLWETDDCSVSVYYQDYKLLN